MKKLLALALFCSSFAHAGEVTTLLPNTYKKIGYVTVYCYDWNHKAPRSTRSRVNMDADSFERCSFTTITYEDHKFTRVIRASALTLDDAQSNNNVWEPIDHRSEWQKAQDAEDTRILIPIFRQEF
jgi:hypothetical protein